MSELKGYTTLEELMEKINKYHTGDDMDLVRRAWAFAEAHHAPQLRKSGEPYFIHPMMVSSILADLMLDATTIAAGLLHDTVEDCKDVCLEDIRRDFGPEVAQLVDGVTKLTQLDFTTREEQQAESLRKMILAMSKDIRVVLIKLADRLHNMKTLKHQSADRQLAISAETLDIYAPLAHRLGVFRIKQELEDLALLYIDSVGYHDLAQKVGMRRAERESAIERVIEQLKKTIDEMSIRCDIAGRPKHFYSIYKKMVLQNKPFEQIYDLIAIRVLVDSVPDCYAVLGIVHTLWKQIPNRFKDYISTPKANMYQSLHTTVVGQNGMPFEVQIRTWEMHRVAEYGIAAHWRYKEGRQVADSLDEKLQWLRQILDWQGETKDSREFMDSLKLELFSDEVFVFTPKGDIVDLPKGATPLDFAYRIHTDVGNRCTGAKINSRMVPLDTELQTGDFVEIATSSSAKGPSRDWLKLVKTSQAKSKIKQWFKRQFKDENMELGHTMLEREAQRQGLAWPMISRQEFIEPTLTKYSFQSMEDLYVAVGCNMLSSSHVVARLMEELRRKEKPPELPPPDEKEMEEEKKQQRQKLASSHGVFVSGDPGMLVRFAGCCNPVPGEEITGFITRGRGVSVHKADCNSLNNVEQERIIEVSWDANVEKAYNVDIQIVATDRDGLLMDINSLITVMNVPIIAVAARVHENGTCSIQMTVKISSKPQLDKLIRSLQKRADIIEVFRLTN